MNPPSVLIVGCGSIGERHLRCFQQTGRCAVAACEPLPSRRQRIAEAYGVPTFADLTAGLRAGDGHAAVICTPAPLHVPFAIEALKAGRHVLIEKPLSHSLAGLEDLFAARQRSGLQVAVAYVYHVYPFLNAARNFLARGEFGPVRHATAASG